ncbi:MAG: sigma-70 family RNA polymerase sigma factor [Vicinamibacterales bacterium]
MPEHRSELTDLLADWRCGNEEAGRQLMTAAYDQLRRLAAYYLHHERADHTLQATELVGELYLRLFSSEPVDWQDRAHFFAVAARQLRRILVDHARGKHAEKRGGSRIRVSLTAIAGLAQPVEMDVLHIDETLRQLEELDPRAAAGVELRFFAGLKETEIAEVLGISLATLHRDWRFCRAWLISQLMPGVKR